MGLKQKIDYTAIEDIHHNTVRDIRNLYRLKKENKAIKDRITRDIRNLL